MTKISAVIVAHNEEKKIEDCLKSLHFADEIVVVLDKCSDGTKAIVQQYTSHIIEGSWHLEGARRNAAVNGASGDWIFEIDADERVPQALADEILEVVKTAKPGAFTVPIANYIGERYVQHGWLRVLGVLQRQTMHYKGLKQYDEDKEIHPTAVLNAHIQHFKTPLIHLVDEDISDLLARFNRYTTWRAQDIISGNKKADGVMKTIVKLKLRFFKSFIIKKGYKEGWMGFLLAILAGLYPLVSALKAKEKMSK